MFGGNLLRQPMATGKNWLHGNLDSTDQIAKRTFWIGVYPGITEEMIGYTTDCIKKTIKDQRK
jgi:CDP-6-deoxy-D-xylo-4-hexulose-3-dehydrase